MNCAFALPLLRLRLALPPFSVIVPDKKVVKAEK